MLVIYLPKITVSIFGLQNAVFKPSTRSLNPCDTKVISIGAVPMVGSQEFCVIGYCYHLLVIGTIVIVRWGVKTLVLLEALASR